MDGIATLGFNGDAPVAVPASGPDAAARARQLDTARKRRARHRKKLLQSLWEPRGVATCPGSGECLLAPPDADGRPSPCSCRPGLPCACARSLFRQLHDEAKRAFGAEVTAGLVARLALDVRMIRGDEVGIGLRLKLADLLLRDARSRELLSLQAKRLRAVEASQPKSLRELLDALPAAPALPAPVASAATVGTGDQPCPV